MKKLSALLVLILIIGVCIVLWQVSRSRTYQFFGQLVARVNTSQKAVALTFDDGPTPRGTDEILSILEEEHIHATFFVIGGELETNMAEAKKIVDGSVRDWVSTFGRPHPTTAPRGRMRSGITG